MMTEQPDRQAEPRPMGNTPITDAAAINAPENPGASYASNADLRVGENHRRDAEIAEQAQPSDQNAEGAGADDLTDNDPSRMDGMAESAVGAGEAGFPMSAGDESDIEDEEENEAQEAQFGAGVTRQQGDSNSNSLGL